jgi:hypothetical protein
MSNVTFDFSEWDEALDKLEGPVRESLARRMAVEGGVLLRDAAKSNAAMAANEEGVPTRGVLSNAILLAQDKRNTTGTVFVYNVAWDSKKAPHGHLIEFGHWQTHVVYKAANGEWYTRKDMPLDTPKWIPARPFLGPTMDSYGNIAMRVMILRGQRELPILLGEIQ